MASLLAKVEPGKMARRLATSKKAVVAKPRGGAVAGIASAMAAGRTAAGRLGTRNRQLDS